MTAFKELPVIAYHAFRGGNAMGGTRERRWGRHMSLECPSEEAVWEYNGGGQMENYIIKELKGGFGMEGLPGGDFGANAVWFALGVLTYNMFVLQKEHLLPEEFRTKTIGTLRWSLVGIPGKGRLA